MPVKRRWNNSFPFVKKTVTRKLASNVTDIAVPNEELTDSNVTVSKQYRMDLYIH
jgi:hypothetical protein